MVWVLSSSSLKIIIRRRKENYKEIIKAKRFLNNKIKTH